MKALSALLLLVALQQQQCTVQSLVGDEATKGIRVYFPKAEIVGSASCTLGIQTHVGNVSFELLKLVADSFARSPEIPKLRMGMDVAGYNFLVLLFNQDEALLFDRHSGVTYVFLTPEDAAIFIRRAPYVCLQQ